MTPSFGQVRFGPDDITTWPERRVRKLRGQMTMVFRNPHTVLNPRMTVRTLLEEPLLLHDRMARIDRRRAAEALADAVRLQPRELDCRPGELTTARLQLVCLARAMATQPRMIVLDEPTAELDVAAAADLLDLLATLRRERNTAIVLITNDIAKLRPVADRIAVLYLGQIVETGPADEMLRDPLHPYTQALLSAHLTADPTQRGRRIRLRGESPPPQERPPGCGFAPRCPLVETRCRTGAPASNQVGPNRTVACVRVFEGTSRIPLSR